MGSVWRYITKADGRSPRLAPIFCVINSKHIAAAVAMLLTMTCAQAGVWVNRYRPNLQEPLCQEIGHRLRSYRWTSPDAYWDVIATDPELQEPPWQDLNPAEHKELLQRLNFYGQRGARAYFDKKHPPDYGVTAEEFYSGFLMKSWPGFRLQVWRARINNVYESGQRAAPPGDQTIVQRRIPLNVEAKRNDPRWRGKPLVAWQADTFFVTGDLSGPDPNVDEGTAGGIVQWSALLLYRGEPYFFNTYGTVFRSQVNVGIQVYCDFQFERERK